jgi:Domain of unknown function (DUF4278)
MQFSYRGISYQAEIATSQSNESNIVGKYRGILTQLGTRPQASQQLVTLRYRGVSYV